MSADSFHNIWEKLKIKILLAAKKSLLIIKIRPVTVFRKLVPAL
jgi:hypothetical protein